MGALTPNRQSATPPSHPRLSWHPPKFHIPPRHLSRSRLPSPSMDSATSHCLPEGHGRTQVQPRDARRMIRASVKCRAAERVVTFIHEQTGNTAGRGGREAAAWNHFRHSQSEAGPCQCMLRTQQRLGRMMGERDSGWQLERGGREGRGKPTSTMDRAKMEECQRMDGGRGMYTPTEAAYLQLPQGCQQGRQRQNVEWGRRAGQNSKA